MSNPCGACDGYCVLTNETLGYICVSKSDYYFCEGPRLLFWIPMIIAALIHIIPYYLAAKNGGYKTTLKDMMFGMLIHLCLIFFTAGVRCQLVFQSSKHAIIGLFALLFGSMGLFGFPIIKLVWFWKGIESDELKGGEESINRSKIEVINNKVNFNPPIIRLNWEIGDKKFSDVVPYRSWRLFKEEKIEFDEVTYLNIQYENNFTRELSQAVEDRRKHIARTLEQAGTPSDVTCTTEIYNVPADGSSYGSTRISKFFKSQEGRTTFYFLTGLGFDDIIRNIHGLKTKKINAVISRSLSHNTDLPNLAFNGQGDRGESYIFDTSATPQNISNSAMFPQQGFGSPNMFPQQFASPNMAPQQSGNFNATQQGSKSNSNYMNVPVYHQPSNPPSYDSKNTLNQSLMSQEIEMKPILPPPNIPNSSIDDESPYLNI
jgi:hypothetical protein